MHSASQKTTLAASAGLPFAYLRKSEVCSVCAISQATLYRLISEGRFPPGVLIGAQSRRWKSTDIASWLNEQAAMAAVREDELGKPLRDKSAKAIAAKRGADHV